MSRMARVVVNQAEMDALLKGQSGAVARDLMQRGRRVETAAKELCPVDHGRLRASITLVGPLISDGELAVQVGTNVEYAIYQELGTRYMAAQPFLAPALDAAFD